MKLRKSRGEKSPAPPLTRSPISLASTQVRRLRQPAHQRTKGVAVAKMIAVMERSPDQCRDAVADFLTTGRTGRRNAMADILGEHVNTGLDDLPHKMEMMNTQGAGADGGECSGTQATASSSSSQVNKDPQTSGSSEANLKSKDADR